MVCKNCGNILISEPNFNLWCPICSPKGEVFSKEDSIKLLQEHYEMKVKKFKKLISKFDLKQLIRRVHSFRNKKRQTFFFDYFSLSLGLGIVLKFLYKLENFSPKDISSNAIQEISLFCNRLYIDKHHLFFTKFDAVRLVKFNPPENIQLKYTENWIPLYKRQFLFGSMPEDPDLSSKEGMNLFGEFHYRQIFLEELHQKNYNYANISNCLSLLQNYVFQYPWDDYLKVGRNKSNIDHFLKISEKLFVKNVLSLKDRNKKFKKEEINYIKQNWLSSIGNSSDFPIIIQIEGNWLVPNTFFSLTNQIYNIFSSENSYSYGAYQNDIGKALENRVFFDLHIYNLDFFSPISPRQELLRYMNPYKSGRELFDVGAIDHKSYKFYVIECKNKIQIRYRNYNPLNLEEYIRKEFEKFRDQYLPEIKKVMLSWNMDSYELVPIFYNFVPLFSEFENLESFKKFDGIYIIQNFAEIGAIIFHNFIEKKLSFNEVYNIPDILLKIIKDDEQILQINPNIEQDYGFNIGEQPESYLILIAEFIKIDDKSYFPELWIRRSEPPYFLYIDIPPENLIKIKNLKLVKGDKISILIYRLSPYVQAYILGRVWKL